MTEFVFCVCELSSDSEWLCIVKMANVFYSYPKKSTESLGGVTEAQQNGSDINLRHIIISAPVPLILAFKVNEKNEWNDWMEMRGGELISAKTRARRPSMRWRDGKKERLEERESLTWPELCDAFHGAAFLLCPLSHSLSLTMQFSAAYALTTDSCSPWERDRDSLTNTNDSRIGLSAKQRDFKHSNFIACTCINRNQNIHASNAAYLAQYYIFSFHYTINYRLIRLKSCPTFSAPPD